MKWHFVFNLETQTKQNSSTLRLSKHCLAPNQTNPTTHKSIWPKLSLQLNHMIEVSNYGRDRFGLARNIGHGGPKPTDRFGLEMMKTNSSQNNGWSKIGSRWFSLAGFFKFFGLGFKTSPISKSYRTLQKNIITPLCKTMKISKPLTRPNLDRPTWEYQNSYRDQT